MEGAGARAFTCAALSALPLYLPPERALPWLKLK